MVFNEFLDDYWDVFCSYISYYHPLDIDFISMFRYDLDWRAMRQNIHVTWNEDLREIIPLEYCWFKYSQNHAPYRNLKLENRLSSEQLGDIRCTLEDRSTQKRMFINLYEDYILPQINGIDISELFYSRLNYDQRFFRLLPPARDSIGYLMKLKVEVRHENRESHTKDNESGSHKLVEVYRGVGEGIPRIRQIALATAYDYSPTLIVSENVKLILEEFNISKYEFVPLEFGLKKLNSNLKYYQFSLEKDSLLKEIDFLESRFYYKRNIDRNKNEKKEVIEKGQIQSYDDIATFKKENKILAVELNPIEYKAETDLDVFSIGSHIVVSQRVKKSLEKYLLNEVLYKSAQDRNIKLIRSANYRSQKPSKALLINEQNITVDDEIQFYFDKMERLETEQPKLEVSLCDDEFKEVQKRLNVIIPESVKEKYRYLKSKNRPHFNLSYEEYEKLEKEGVTLLDDGLELISENSLFFISDCSDYSKSIPEAYKAISIGEFGGGDEIGLILEKNDDFLLQEEIYFFSHEDGKMYPYDDLYGHFELSKKEGIPQVLAEENELVDSSKELSNEEIHNEEIHNIEKKKWWKFW